MTRAWHIVLCVSVLAVVLWAVWQNDQANAEKVAVIDRALTSCTAPLPPVTHRSFFD